MSLRPKTLGQFAIETRQMAGGLDGAMQAATKAAAFDVTSAARDAIRSDSGGDSVLSGVGKRGTKVGARFDMVGPRLDEALVRATGPMQIIENDTDQHQQIPSGIGRARRQSRRAAKQQLYEALFGSSGFAGTKPLAAPGGPFYRVNHPGTRGKHTWARAIEKAKPKVPQVYQKALNAHLRKFFG
jgi:hypothetical protein